MRKLTAIALGGIALGIVCIGAAAVIDGPRLAAGDWKKLHIAFDGLDECKPTGSTATSRELEWTGEDRITLAVPGTVHYTPGDGERISASGDPDLLAHLRIRHHTLGLDCDHDGMDGKLDITLPGRTFHSFAIAGSGKLELEKIDQPMLELAVAGSGAIDLNGHADRIKARIAGSGDIEASGNADSVDLTIAGSGDAHMGKLAAHTADINIAGSGNAEVAPTDAARIKIAGSGDVRLVTEPKDVDTRVFGSGRILHGAAKASDD